MRKLAHVEVIESIKSIENADNIVSAQVLGWQVIVKKGEVNVGDKVVYFEIDSILPAQDKRYEFLGGVDGSKFKNYRTENGFKILGHKLKTMKLRGSLSQGLALPIDIFEEINKDIEVGTDVTNLLKIYKYEALEENNGSSSSSSSKGSFPSFIPKTSQERIQNIYRTVENKPDLKYVIQQKIDGSSSTFYFKNGKVGICSRNLELRLNPIKVHWLKKLWYRIVKKKIPIIDLNTVWHSMNNKYSITDTLIKYGKNIAIQGEIIGGSIQGNYEKVNEQMFKVFDIYDIDKQKYLGFDELLKVVKDLNSLSTSNFKLETVPVIAKNVSLLDLGLSSLDKILDFSEGSSMINSSVKREGLVFHSIDGLESFKVISNSYLLKRSKEEDKFDPKSLLS